VFFFWSLFCGGLAVSWPAGAAQHWIGIGGRVESWTNAAAADRVRLGVKDTGVYRVDAQELAAASGWDADALRAALQTNGLALTCRSVPVAWSSDAEGSALFFYGRETDEAYAPENVYWLAPGAGQRIGNSPDTPSAVGATNLWFMDSESCRPDFVVPSQARDRRSQFSSLGTNLFIWGCYFPAKAAQTREVALPGFQAGTTAEVSVAVSACSYWESNKSPVDRHCLQVLMNGADAGSLTWTNEQAVSAAFALPSACVTNGAGVGLTVTNAFSDSGTVNEFLFLDGVVSYPRAYRCVGEPLLCTGGGGAVTAVSGLPEADTAVWDVTAEPSALRVSAETSTDGTWRVAFSSGDVSRRYAVWTPSLCWRPSVRGVAGTDWMDAAEMPALAIVIPPRHWAAGFDAAVEPLRAFREAQGLSARVIDADEIYAAFSDGIVCPDAFRRFAAAGLAAGTLKYVLFAGQAGADYKHLCSPMGSGKPFPTFFPVVFAPFFDPAAAPAGASVSAILPPNDVILGDADFDGVPDVAVGRFIASNLGQLSNMVGKAIGYERSGVWKYPAACGCSADTVLPPTAFGSTTEALAGSLSASGWRPLAAVPASGSDSSTKPLLLDMLEGGCGFLFFLGHGSDTVLRISGSSTDLLKFNTASGFAEIDRWPYPVVALILGCRFGRWTTWNVEAPYAVGTCCGAALAAYAEGRGFAASIVSSGYAADADACLYGEAFGDELAGGASRLGDAWLGAFRSVGLSAVTNLYDLAFLGDPATWFRPACTARGTPTDWLAGNGLTNSAYADLDDPDADGYPTWMEYQAGTAFDAAQGFVITGLSLGNGTLSFTPPAGSVSRVLTTTNLAGGVWSVWREGVPGDWPVKAVDVPMDGPMRFFKVEQ
jgi:hypothetical protein